MGIRIKLGTTWRAISKDTISVTDEDTGAPIMPVEPGDFVPFEYLDANYPPNGLTQVVTIIDTVDWPYSTMLRDLTFTDGVLTNVGAPYEET